MWTAELNNCNGKYVGDLEADTLNGLIKEIAGSMLKDDSELYIQKLYFANRYGACSVVALPGINAIQAECEDQWEALKRESADDAQYWEERRLDRISFNHGNC